MQHMFLCLFSLQLFLFALGKNSVVLILSACGVKKSQALAEYNRGFFVSSLVMFLMPASWDIFDFDFGLIEPLFWGSFVL